MKLFINNKKKPQMDGLVKTKSGGGVNLLRGQIKKNGPKASVCVVTCRELIIIAPRTCQRARPGLRVEALEMTHAVGGADFLRVQVGPLNAV